MCNHHRIALEIGDVGELAQLMRSNFALRRSMFGDAALGATNLRMIAVAERVGAAAKFTGSGGAIVALCPDGAGQVEKLKGEFVDATVFSCTCCSTDSRAITYCWAWD